MSESNRRDLFSWLSAAGAVSKGLCLRPPLILLGKVRRVQSIGGGFWKIGIERYEHANATCTESLGVLLRLSETLSANAESAVSSLLAHTP